MYWCERDTHTGEAKMTDERHAELERQMEREIAKGYRKADRTPEADLPEDRGEPSVEGAI